MGNVLKQSALIFPLKLSAIMFLFLCLLSPGAEATDWYVRSTAGGNGTSWTNAWGDVTQIAWGSVKPGDTLWIAGGSYGSLSPTANGTGDPEAQRVKIKRATATAHGADTGWNGAWATQVVLSEIIIGSDYLTIDGQVERG